MRSSTRAPREEPRVARRRVGVAGTAMALLVPLTASALASDRPTQTERVSVATDGSEGNGNSRSPSLSADGRYVAFTSSAENLVADDTNGVADVFVHDRDSDEIERVSVATDGTQGKTFGSFNPTITPDGRYVAFEGVASLEVGDTNGYSDVYVHDRATGATERASETSDGKNVHGGPSTHGSLSSDGRYVAFSSLSPSVVEGDTNVTADVFVKDRVTGVVERVSVDSDGSQAAPGNAGSLSPSISGDGRYVAFLSYAPNLVAHDSNVDGDVFVHDRDTGMTKRVSVATDGSQANDGSGPGVLSGDGRYVAFHSLASNLVPSDINNNWDVFLYDLKTGAIERVSLPSDGVEDGSTELGSGSSLYPSLSSDGRYIAFQSFSSTLVEGDTNSGYDVFVHDRELGLTERVSVGSEGQESTGEHPSYPAVASDKHFVSDDGRFAAFWSAASNLVSGDSNARWDVFVRDRGPSVGIGALSIEPESGGFLASGWAAFAGSSVASAVDSTGDGNPNADTLGADLTGADVIYRAERGDLLVDLDLASLPQPTAGLPGVIYGMRFETETSRYEIRSLRVGTTSIPSRAPSFGLYDCTLACHEVAALRGGLGTAGSEIRIALPLDLVGISFGSELHNLRAFTSQGEAASGSLVGLDDVALPDVSLPEPLVLLGIAPTGTPEHAVDYALPASLNDGSFSGGIDTRSLDAGIYEIWARACIGDACGSDSVEVMVDSAVQVICYEDDDPGLIYEPGWRGVDHSDASNGRFRVSHAKDVTFDLGLDSAQGTLQVFYGTSDKGGTGDVYVDEIKVGSVQYAGTGSINDPDFGPTASFPVAGTGIHHVEFRNAGGFAYLDRICVLDGG